MYYCQYSISVTPRLPPPTAHLQVLPLTEPEEHEPRRCPTQVDLPPPCPVPCPSRPSLPRLQQWAVPRLPTYPPPSPGSACGRSHSCAPPSPLSSGACGRSHGCSPPLPLTTRPIIPPAEWPSGQPHELLSGSRGFDSLPSPCTPNTQHRKYSIGSCTTRNCILPACITYLPTSAIGYIVLLPVLYLRDPSPTAPHSTSAGASSHRT